MPVAVDNSFPFWPLLKLKVVTNSRRAALAFSLPFFNALKTIQPASRSVKIHDSLLCFFFFLPSKGILACRPPSLDVLLCSVFVCVCMWKIPHSSYHCFPNIVDTFSFTSLWDFVAQWHILFGVLPIWWLASHRICFIALCWLVIHVNIKLTTLLSNAAIVGLVMRPFKLSH